jgi:phage gpG-like protein
MPAQFKIELTEEAKGVIRAQQAMPAQMLIAQAMDYQNALTVSHIQKNYLSFPKDGPSVEIGLRVETNRLRSALFASPSRVQGLEIDSAIGDSVSYAAIHEFGGRIPARKIVAKNAKALQFTIGGRVIYAKSVNIPAFDMPARAPIQRGIEDRLAKVGDAISEAIVGSSGPTRSGQ